MIFRVIILSAFLFLQQCFAALEVTSGQFAASTAGTTTTVTTDFQGKAVIFWTAGQITAGLDNAANAMFSIGFSDGTGHRSISWATDDNVNPTNAGKTMSLVRAVEILSAGTPTVVRGITGVAFNATPNMVVTFDDTPAAAYLINYILLGGSDITNVLVGHDTMPTATGTWSIDNGGSSVGFTADFGIFLYNQLTASGGTTLTNGAIGFASSSAKEFTMSWGVDDAASMTANIDAVSYTNANACLSYITNGAETVDLLVDFTQFTSTGADVNISNAQATANTLMPFLFIKGGQWDVGTVAWSTGISATTTVSGMAFQPQGVFLAHNSAVADATVTAQTTNFASTSVGAASSSTTDYVTGAGQVDAALNTSVYRYTNSDGILEKENAHASFTNFASDGWVATNNASAYAAYRVGWFAMADNAAAPSCAAGQNIALLGVGCR